MAKRNKTPEGGWLFDILNIIERALTDKSRIKFRESTIEIVNKNARSNQTHINSQGFFFRGELFHKLAPGIPTKGLVFGSLSEELIPEMEFLLKDRADEKFTLSRIRNVLSLVLSQAKDLQDVRDSLPNCLVDLIPDLTRYPRVNEEAFLIKNDYTKYRQYELIKPKIEFLCAMRFFN